MDRLRNTGTVVPKLFNVGSGSAIFPNFGSISFYFVKKLIFFLIPVAKPPDNAASLFQIYEQYFTPRCGQRLRTGSLWRARRTLCGPGCWASWARAAWSLSAAPGTA